MYTSSLSLSVSLMLWCNSFLEILSQLECCSDWDLSRISGCSATAVHADVIRADEKYVTIMNRAASTTTNGTNLHVGDVGSLANFDDIGSRARFGQRAYF